MARKKKEGYEVGFGRPPKETRFKKGQSGNPKGRPKGSLNFKTIALKELNELVPIGGPNGRVQVTAGHAALKLLKHKALVERDRKALMHFLDLFRELASTVANDIDEDLAPEDEAILEAYESQILRKRADDGEGGNHD